MYDKCMSCVYALVLESAPEDYRYIGRTSQTTHRRLSKHRTAARTTDGAYLGRWIRKAWSAGETIGIVVLEDELTYEESGVREIALIKYYRDQGFRLTNISGGGDGGRLGSSGWKHTEESLAKMRGNNHRLGKKDSDETKKKKSLSSMGNKSNTGKKATEESKANMREAQRKRKESGWVMSEESRAKISRSHIGMVVTEETRKKMSESGKKRWSEMSAETLAEISESRKGNKHSLGRKMTEEQKAKLGARATGNTYALGHRWSDDARAKMSIDRKIAWAKRKAAVGK